MRCSQVLLALLVATTASADPITPRKPANAGFTKEQLAHWAKAVTADKAGDLDEAQGEYEKVNAANPRDPAARPLANAAWNLADVQRRREHYPAAIEQLELYKTLATSGDERAAADTVIAEIRATPYRVWISGLPEATAIVYIDGVRVGTAPMGRALLAGWHQIDMISATAYDQRSVEAKPMTSDSVEMRRSYGTSGNVVLSTSFEFRRIGTWDTDGVRYELPRRKDYAPGHYETQPWNEAGGLCKPIAFDVPKRGLLFVYVDAEPKPKGGGCQPVKIVAQMVKLP